MLPRGNRSQRFFTGGGGAGFPAPRHASDSTAMATIDPIPAEVFKVNPRDRAWVNAQCTPHPLATFEQRIWLKGAIARVPKIAHVLATEFQENSLFPACHERAKAKGWSTHTIPCGHDAMLDLPDDVAALLLRFA